MGMAPLTMSPFAAWLVSHYDWRTAMTVIAVLAWVLLIPSAVLVRAAPRPEHAAAAASAEPVKPAPRLTAAFLSAQFIVLGMTFFFCCAAHSGPLFHFVSYAITCGVPMMTAVSIYSVEGLAGLGGRLLFGVAADRLGVKPVLIGGLVVQSIAILAYMFAHDGHGVWRRDHAFQPGDGSGARRGRLDLRHLSRLPLAISELDCRGARSGRGRLCVSALAPRAAQRRLRARLTCLSRCRR